MAATELVLYMAWRKAWFERKRNGQILGPISMRDLFALMRSTAEYMKLKVNLPDKRQFVVIIDRLWTRGILAVRDVEEEAYVFVPDQTGKDMESSLRRVAAGKKVKFAITESVRDMHAKFVRRSVWKALGKEVSQEQIADLMKQASGVPED